MTMTYEIDSHQMIIVFNVIRDGQIILRNF